MGSKDLEILEAAERSAYDAAVAYNAGQGINTPVDEDGDPFTDAEKALFYRQLQWIIEHEDTESPYAKSDEARLAAELVIALD